MGDKSKKMILRKYSPGFTLLELMLVLAVISILAIVSVPKYQAVTDHYHLDSSVQGAVAKLRLAKQTAMDGRQQIAVGFTNKKVQLYVVDDTGGSRHYTLLGEPYYFDTGIEFSSSDSLGLVYVTDISMYVMSFDLRGSALALGGTPGYAANIKLKSTKTGASLMINIGAGTGFVTYS